MPTPEEWRDTLYPRITNRAPKLQEYDNYYDGKHPLPFLNAAHAENMKTNFRQMLQESQTNFMKILIDTVHERLRIEGIRLSATSDPTSDKDSWDIWQANQMDSLHADAIMDALIKGVSYISVWEDTNDDGYPDISVEDPKECIVVYTPGTNFRKRDAALKIWRDDIEKRERATLYLPDTVYRWWRNIGTPDSPLDSQYQRKIFDPDVPFKVERDDVDSLGTSYISGTSTGQGGWEELETDHQIPNPMGVVPIIPIRNRGRLLVEGESEMGDSTNIQRQINSFLFLLALAGYFGAHKQRWAVGLELMEDEDGVVEQPFDIAVDKMLVAEDENVKFGEFAETSLDGYIKAIDQKAGHIAIKHKLPKHYFLPEGQSPSGDALVAAESGLVRLAKGKSTKFDDGFEEAMRLARKLQTGEDTPIDSEMVWSDPATTSQAAVSDSVLKKFEAGLIGHEQALEDLGYTQTQITRIMKSRTKDQLLKLSPETPAPATGPTPPPKPPPK